MNAHRLELVAKKLDENPPFDFSVWIGPTWKGAQDLSCGATACALGWAATIPELQEAGLRIDGRPTTTALSGNIVPASACIGYVGPYAGYQNLAWSTSIRAACSVFEINEDQAVYLFEPSETLPGLLSKRATAAQVAKHIRDFIQRGGIHEYREIDACGEEARRGH